MLEVEREIVRQRFAVEDVAQQFAVARPQDDVVMGERRHAGIAIAAVCAEVDHDQRHRVAHPGKPAIGILSTRRGVEQVFVRARDVGVAHDNISIQRCAVLAQADADRAAVRGNDPLHFGAEHQRAAEFLEQCDERIDDGAGAAHCEPDAPFAFEMMDERVDAGGLKRIPADQQRVETKAPDAGARL